MKCEIKTDLVALLYHYSYKYEQSDDLCVLSSFSHKPIYPSNIKSYWNYSIIKNRYSHIYFWKETQSSPTLCYNSTTYKCKHISCTSKEPLLKFPYCATFSDETKLLSVIRCPYCFQPNSHNVTIGEQLTLPRNLSQLNDYMCGPFNRKGLVCSECADGFGPSVTSFGHRYVNCTDIWYGVPLFLLLEFAPITVLYLVILVLQISITSAPLPCFIMYAQFIIITFDSSNFF